MEKTIFNVYVEMQDQATCDRMKQLCVDNGLDYWDDFRFNVIPTENHIYFYFYDGDFCNWQKIEKQTKVTETEFIELLKQYKNDNI